MRVYLFVLILLIVPFSIFCQSYGKVEESTLKKVVNIEGNGTGTGFLVAKKSKYDSSAWRIFLVTNKHMIGEWSLVDTFIPKKTIAFFLYTTDSVSRFKAKRLNIIDSNNRISEFVKLHPNPQIDVAVIDITKEIVETKNLDVDFFDISFLIPIGSISSSTFTGIGDEVYAIGYPAGITSIKTNKPIVKAGIISSDLSGSLEINSPVKNRKNKIVLITAIGKYFLVDGLIIGGNSGGPIILPKEVKFKMENKILQSTEKAIPNLVFGIVSSGLTNTGISFVYSCDHILEVINDFGEF